VTDSARRYRVVEAFRRIPSLVHGFGTRYWGEDGLDLCPELAGFRHVSLRQTHSDIVRIIAKYPHEKMEGDALVTERPGNLLIIKTADCLPVLVVDPQKRVVAAVHCGWRGTLKNVIGKTIRMIAQNFGSDLSYLRVALGPCIDKSCYEVGEDVRERFEHHGISNGNFDRHPTKREKYLFDLRGANRAQILSMGVPREQIFSVDLCTYCENDLFSYRRDKAHAGRLVNFIGLC
jgi:YfiH family protein